MNKNVFRILITGLGLAAYSVSSYLCVASFHSTPPLEIYKLRTWLNFNAGVIILFTLIDEIFGYVNYIHKQFNWLCRIAFIINIFIAILTYQSVIYDPLYFLKILNGSIFVITIIIVTSGINHGIFKD